MAETTCTYCGRECGNAGAKKNHEEACDENPDNAGGQRARPPARDQGRQADRRADPPARRDEGRGTGDALADGLIAAIDDDIPQQTRTQAITEGLGAVGTIISRWQEHRQQKMEMREERAKNVELEPVEDLPACGECGYQFGAEDIGLKDEKVRCPECNTVYRLRSSDAPIDA